MSRQYSYLKYQGLKSVFNTKAMICDLTCLSQLHPAMADIAHGYCKDLSMSAQGLVGANHYVKEGQSLAILEISPKVFGTRISTVSLIIELMDFYLFEGWPVDPVVPDQQKLAVILSRAQLVNGKRNFSQVTANDIAMARDLSLYLTAEFGDIMRSGKTIVDFVALEGIVFIVYE